MSNNQQIQKRSGLGGNPLHQSLFSRTEDISRAGISENLETENLETENLESRKYNPESRFLDDIDSPDKESIGLQVTASVNDWLDEMIKGIRRKHGRKIPKQILIQAGVELLRVIPVDWTDIKDLDALRSKLSEIASILRNELNKNS